MTMPSVPPYSSTTIARCWPAVRISVSASRTPLVPGITETVSAMSATVAERSTPAGGASRSRSRTTPITSSTSSPITGKRECRCTTASRAARETVSDPCRNSTSRLATMTSRTLVSSAANTSAITRRSTMVSDSWASTSDCSSSWLITSPEARGSPPSNRTTPLVHLPSTHTTGRNSLASTDNGPEATSAMVSLRCRPSLFGASSPSTNEMNEITSVVPTSAMVSDSPADIPSPRSHPDTRSATVAAPNAEDNIVANVTPICTAARNWLGSDTRRSSRWPRLPRVSANCRTWLSRIEIIDVSAAAKAPPTMIRATISRISRTRVLMPDLPGTSATSSVSRGGAGRGQCARRALALPRRAARYAVRPRPKSYGRRSRRTLSRCGFRARAMCCGFLALAAAPPDGPSVSCRGRSPWSVRRRASFHGSSIW